MFISRKREKLLNAIIFFVANTRNCNTVKIFKLLNFLDFEHFRQTGESVTGLDYFAWEQGPVPSALWNEMKKPAPDFSSSIGIENVRDELTEESQRRVFKPLVAFNKKIFTRRELEIMEQLAFIFGEASAKDMSQCSHSPKMPWKKVYDPNKSNKIPYELTLSSASVINKMPTISSDEFEFRKEAFKEVMEHMSK